MRNLSSKIDLKKDGADNMTDIKNLKKLRKRARLTQSQLVAKVSLTNLKKLRKRARLNQLQLAAKVGVSPSTIFRWEKGKNIPHPERLKKLNQIFSHLLEDKEQMWFWTKEHQKEEQEAEAELHQGKGKKVENVNELIDELNE